MPFTYTQEDLQENVILMKVSGPMNGMTPEEKPFYEELARYIAKGNYIIVDLANIQYFNDFAPINIMRIDQSAQGQGGIKLVVESPSVRQLLMMTFMGDFSMYENLESALESIN